MENSKIDYGNKFDWDKTSSDYSKYRDISYKACSAEATELKSFVFL